MADLTRRWLALVALTTLVIPQPAFAESVLEKTLDGVTDSLAAAAKLTAGVVLRVAALQPAAFQPSERPKVASQLADFDDALTQMAMAQRIVMGDVDSRIILSILEAICRKGGDDSRRQFLNRHRADAPGESLYSHRSLG